MSTCSFSFVRVLANRCAQSHSPAETFSSSVWSLGCRHRRFLWHRPGNCASARRAWTEPILGARRQGLLEELASDLIGREGHRDTRHRRRFRDKDRDRSVAAGSGDLDGLLVAAAGFGTSGPFLDSDLTQELEMLDVNCRALLSQSLHFGRRFAERGRGGLIFLVSLVGFRDTPFYAATKAYVQSLAEALHVELAVRGVDVLASAPGPVQSGFAARAGMRIGAALKPADVAQATLDAVGCKTTVVPGLLLSRLRKGTPVALSADVRDASARSSPAS